MMGASRQSYKISVRWKYSGKTFSQRIHSVFTLFMDAILFNDGKLFIKDNFIQPFDKLIGCKLFGHKWLMNFPSMSDRCICDRCNIKSELNLHTLEWEIVKEFSSNIGTDEEIKKRWTLKK